MTISEYLAGIPRERLPYFERLRESIKRGLPEGFVEQISSGMIGYVVPHSIYPAGYHCNPKDPLPYMNIASKKTGFSLYHLAIYGNKELYDWFMEGYSKIAKHKIDSGAGCVRFKYLEEIPFDLISELAAKMSVREWIEFYESTYKPKKP